MDRLHFKKLAIVGVGLIGGSVAARLKRAGRVDRVIGVGRSRGNIARALELGVIDEAAEDPALAARQADLVLIAVPVQQTIRVLERLKGAARAGTVITDAGSTKRDFVAAVREVVGAPAPNIVPAHPVAGAEHTGVQAASAELFEGKRVVITPLPENRAEAVELVESMWRACGARITRMTPEHHDEVFSAVSHLPHVVAYALVHMIAARDGAEELFSFAASGFRDFTRIASSSPEMWRDICIANRDAIAADLEAFQGALGEVAALIRAGDGEALARVFEAARNAREAWLRKTP
ncbi:MAG TPA: prephenate dehydrogenase/arogenate dehydrogenase family protein [Burkholderiales bacterium]|nr:prephenate dehydrogenase/arogenate dehydrogenase family protein [Burkholderiales bacterium]